MMTENHKVYRGNISDGSYICHHGVKGQKWGVRRYQNTNGSLKSAGKKRYSGKSGSSSSKSQTKTFNEVAGTALSSYMARRKVARAKKTRERNIKRSQRIYIMEGALGAYAAYSVTKFVKRKIKESTMKEVNRILDAERMKVVFS